VTCLALVIPEVVALFGDSLSVCVLVGLERILFLREGGSRLVFGGSVCLSPPVPAVRDIFKAPGRLRVYESSLVQVPSRGDLHSTRMRLGFFDRINSGQLAVQVEV
jgi:hypothetical protein